MANQDGVSIVKALDARIQQSAPFYKIEQGSSTTFYQQNAPNNSSSSNLAFNIVPPSMKVITDRVLEYSGSVVFKTTVNFTGIPVMSKSIMDFGLNCTFGDFPLNKVFQNTTLQINNASVHNKSADNFNILKWMMHENSDGIQKGTPSRLERYQNYSGSAVFPNSNINGVSTSIDTQAPANGSFEGVEFCREDGSTLPNSTTAATYTVSGGNPVLFLQGIPLTCNTTGGTTGDAATSFVVFIKLTVSERAFISPFIFNESHDAQTGLYNISSLQISHTLGSPQSLIKLDKTVKYGTVGVPSTVSGIIVAFNDVDPWKTMRLNMVYRTPSVFETPPLYNTVPYTEFQTNKTTRQMNIAPGAKTSITSNAVTTSVVPNMIIIALKPSIYDSDESEYFFPPDSISIDYGNQSSLCNTINKQQLYEMSYKNGVQMSRQEWYGEARQNSTNYTNSLYTTARGAGFVPLCGGFISLIPGVDFPLPATLAGGVGINNSFNVTVNYTNRLNKEITSVELVTIFVQSGFIMSGEGSSIIKLLPITVDDVANTPVDSNASVGSVVVGGSFWGKIGSFLKKNVYEPTKNFVTSQDGRNKIKSLARSTKNPYLNTAANVADAIGLGKGNGIVHTGGMARTGGRSGLQSLYM